MASGSSRPPPSGANLPSKQCLAELFESGRFSDAIIKVSDREIKVHKAVLSAKSPWFKEHFDNTPKHAGVPVILHDRRHDTQYSYSATKAMIQFCYTGDYLDLTEPSFNGRLVVHLVVHELAHEYEVEGLAELSSRKYTDGVNALFGKLDPDKLTTHLGIAIRSDHGCTETMKLVKSQALRAFKSLISKLEQLDDPGQALSKIEEVFDKSKEMKEVQNLPYSWKCHTCASVFQYSSKPTREDMYLPVCPCCGITQDFGLTRQKRKRA
ncbi:hypothetical protein K491DRAFT_774788 [Lophiostoma macrostomum CBS 122681]|uniref:BTB domain-containing protein n=1 Tax=Lophiostoma macrostomum CBS 122681 TaxID=1314788 RepID=A0A6A6TJV6_9PLEO|nr:hypothetical protein K491DRAFT_774788 [Lophiostoma macrostomum CBS 122681]